MSVASVSRQSLPDPSAPRPSVSVLLPLLDEAPTVDAVLASLAAQDLPDPYEVVVADGGSTDGTPELVASWEACIPRLMILANPRRLQAHGLNLAAAHASGDILVRADGHTVYAPDYLRRCVEALTSGDAVAVGGNLRPRAGTPFGLAVAAVLSSPLAVGPGKFHYARRRQAVDTVYLGAFRRADFLDVGGYRALPSGAAEDADLYHRWRQQGRRILLDPAIRSTYFPRETPREFWRQSLRYGRAKAELLWLSGRLPSWRPLAPLALVTGLIAGAAAGALVGDWRALRWLVTLWFGVLAVVVARAGRNPDEESRHLSARHGALVAAATVIMHVGYGFGLAAGLLRGPGPLRGLRGVGPASPREPAEERS